MAALPISVIIRAVDRATAPIRRIGAAINRGLGAGLRGVARAGSLATSVLKGMLASLTGLAVVGAAALAKVTSDYIETADAIATFAEKAGIGAAAYQELAYAAERSDVEVGEFQAALLKLQNGLGQVKAGTGSLNKFLDKLPKSFSTAVRGAKNNQEALELVLAAMTKIEDPARRAAFAAQFFGNKLGATMALAANGADGLAKLREEARRAGVVIGDDALEAAGDLDNKLIAMKATIKGVTYTIAKALVPAIGPLVGRLTAWIQANRELIGQKVQAAFTAIGDAVGRIDFDKIRAGLAKFRDVVVETWDRLGGLESILKIIGGLMALSIAGSVASATLALGAFAAMVAGKVVGALALATGAAKALFVAIAANPLGALVAAMTLAVITVEGKWGPIVAWFERLWDRIKAAFATVGMFFEQLWSNPVDTLKATWGAVSGFFSDLWDDIKAIFRGAWEFIEGIVAKVRDAAEFVSTAGGLIGGAEQAAASKAQFGRDAGQFAFGDRGALAAPGMDLISALQGMGRAEVGGKIEISFKDMPQGVEVSRPTATNPRVPIQTNVGRRTAALPGGR